MKADVAFQTLCISDQNKTHTPMIEMYLEYSIRIILAIENFLKVQWPNTIEVYFSTMELD